MTVRGSKNGFDYCFNNNKNQYKNKCTQRNQSMRRQMKKNVTNFRHVMFQWTSCNLCANFIKQYYSLIRIFVKKLRIIRFDISKLTFYLGIHKMRKKSHFET